MRRGAALAVIFGAAAVLAAAQLAGAQVVERIRISDATRTQHGLPPGLIVELESPVDYNRSVAAPNGGSWSGPAYVARDGSSSGASSIDWTATFDERQGPTEAIAAAYMRRGWARDQRGGLSVPRVVGNRIVGTILGYYHLHSPGGGDARFEAVLAFPLDANLHAVVRIELLNPPSDEYVVRGIVTGSTWNRGQALLALSGIRLQGNLPPKIVSARAFQRGRQIRGRVLDRFLDPVVGASIALERQAGSRWTRVARGRTSPRGAYSLRAGRRGTYRVTVNMAGFRAESRPLRAGGGRRR
jgi:hypothetical protein